jgi:hypothetical protein
VLTEVLCELVDDEVEDGDDVSETTVLDVIELTRIDVTSVVATAVVVETTTDAEDELVFPAPCLFANSIKLVAFTASAW